MIRAIIVDDELPALTRMKSLLAAYSDLDIVGEAHDGLEALSLIAEKKPDVVFLDIDMPELSGLEVAQTLGVRGPLLIFTTAHDEFALKAFESNAIDYLVKPINKLRLELTIEKLQQSLFRPGTQNVDAIRILAGKPVRLAVKVGIKYEVFDPALISAAIAEDHYTSLIIEGRKLLADDSLESIFSRLDPELFVRVHRGAVINIKFVKELKREGDRKFTVLLNDKLQTQIPVSRERLALLKKFLGID